MNASRATMVMIYMGTLLISVLSFFTTYKGMNIILSWELALLGSLGLQTAMLGIAWSLIKIKDNRSSYIMAFTVAASFSIFFSYASFDTNLKENTRPREMRNAYYETSMPVMADYSRLAKNAGLISQYQVDRLKRIIEMEQEKGWATIIDEGSQDKFIQSIIEGARVTVDSWRRSTGTDYRQGKGKGIITNYLESRQDQARNNYIKIREYSDYVDSLALKLNADMMVERQHELVNKAYVSFPVSVVNMIKYDSETINLPAPPMPTEFAEAPANTQQALMMVIGDLYEMDKLTLLALLLAIAIDFIVIAIAFAGSHIMAKADVLLDRIEGESLRRMKNIEVDDVENFNKFLDTNLNAYKKAAQYGKDIDKILDDYQNAKNRLQELNKRNLSPQHEDSGIQPLIVKDRSRLDKWLSSSKQAKKERNSA